MFVTYRLKTYLHYLSLLFQINSVALNKFKKKRFYQKKKFSQAALIGLIKACVQIIL